MRSIVEKTRQVELGLTHGTEKEWEFSETPILPGRADWHLAILTLPPAWTGRGLVLRKKLNESAQRKALRQLFFRRRSVPTCSDLIV